MGGMHWLFMANHFDDRGSGFGVPSVIYAYAWSEPEGKNVFMPVNPKPETLNPKPDTRNFEPETLNPKPPGPNLPTRPSAWSLEAYTPHRGVWERLARAGSEDSAYVGAIGLALEPHPESQTPNQVQSVSTSGAVAASYWVRTSKFTKP